LEVVGNSLDLGDRLQDQLAGNDDENEDDQQQRQQLMMMVKMMFNQQ
jgi:hypothetical protein